MLASLFEGYFKVPSCRGILPAITLRDWRIVLTSARIYRVILPVADLERAVHFYQQLLDESGMRISPGRHYFNCGGVILAVYSPIADGDRTEPRPNFEHIYFAVANLDDIYSRAQRVGGLSTADGDGTLPMGTIATRPWGERSFYMHDPFGNPLCFVDEGTLFTTRPS